MRFLILALAAFALLLAGCAGSAQQPTAADNGALNASSNGGAPLQQGNGTEPGANANETGAPIDPAAQLIQDPASQLPAQDAMGISRTALAAHNSETDCWVGYNGAVYDITAFLPSHKDYKALIVPLCGTADEFQAKFIGQHDTSKISVLESQAKIGNLAAQ
ncbi:MAG: cytochrome b5 domain-containing protein [Candidatus Micrarchaeia archaeon]